jgi:DNA-binding NarL/FixJ family response regulator
MGSGLDLIRPLTATGAAVIMLTAERRRAALAEYLEQGAVGWVGKDAELDEVDSTVGRALSGQMIIGRTERAELLERLRLEREQSSREHAIFERLTEREACVLAALTDGLSAEQIAEENFVSLATVRSQIRAVLQKLGVRSQLAAVAIASPHRDVLPQRGSGDRDRRRVQASDRRSGLSSLSISPA